MQRYIQDKPVQNRALGYKMVLKKFIVMYMYNNNYIDSSENKDLRRGQQTNNYNIQIHYLDKEWYS